MKTKVTMTLDWQDRGLENGEWISEVTIRIASPKVPGTSEEQSRFRTLCDKAAMFDAIGRMYQLENE